MRFRSFIGVVVFAGGLCLCAAPARQQPPEPKQADLPDGPGKEAVKTVCGKCHPIESVVASRRTRTGWERMTDDMVSRGAKGTDEQMDAVVDYLTAHFGKVNVNAAPAAEIQELAGLSEKEAKAIVAFREQNGKFKSFEELLKVPGVNEERLKAKRPQIAFNP